MLDSIQSNVIFPVTAYPYHHNIASSIKLKELSRYKPLNEGKVFSNSWNQLLVKYSFEKIFNVLAFTTNHLNVLNR